MKLLKFRKLPKMVTEVLTKAQTLATRSVFRANTIKSAHEQLKAKAHKMIPRDLTWCVAIFRPENEEGKLDDKWDLFPFGSILLYSCVRWLEDVGGYKTPAAIQKIHRPKIVRKILQSFTSHGDGGVQVQRLRASWANRPI